MLARLEGAVSQITRFTADASHELRSPLSLIRTMAEVALRNPRIDAESADVFRGIVTEAEAAALLLDDMLTLARSDAGHVETAFEPIDLTGLLCEVCARGRSARQIEATYAVRGPERLHLAAGKR
jgi:signal transduction histidine kinase